MTNFFEKLVYYTEKIPYGKKITKGILDLMSKYTAKHIAIGFGIGVFWGVMPTFGTGILWAFITAHLFRVSRISAVIGSLVSNPITAPFFYGLGLFVGSAIAGIQFSSDVFLESIKNLDFSTTFLKLILGNVIVSAFFAIVFGLIVYFGINHFEKKKLESK